MKIRRLGEYLNELEKTSSRLEITRILADLFKELRTEETDKAAYLILGELAPKYEGIVLNLAERMMIRVISQSYQVPDDEVLKTYKKLGDLGDVAYELAVKKGLAKAGDLNIEDVHKKLLEVAEAAGEGSQEVKVSLMSELLSLLDPVSARYVARIPVGKLRLGFSEKTVLDGLSWMETGGKSAKSKLEKAYQVAPDVGDLAKRVKEVGIDRATKGAKPKVGVPVAPMLAQRIKSPSEMIKKMGKVAVEPKLDGLRLSIHYKAGKNGFVKAYTRNMNETSWMFPELEKLSSHVKAKEVIFDSEAIGLDEKTLQLADFQTTMTRRRKHEIQEVLARIGIKFYLFDILCLDGENLMDKPYLQRRQALKKTVNNGSLLQIVDNLVTDDPAVISRLNAQNRAGGFEGIMVKRLDSEYVPGRTGWRWVKMKESEEATGKLSDTVDCVVMGYSAGKGKRAGFGVGQFLVGVVDAEQIKTVTKIGTGLTDEQFRELKRRLSKLEVKNKPKEYVLHKNLTPDYWVMPSQVVEIAADDITRSPLHSSGLALRFPRLVRFRDDRNPSQATSVGEVEKLYQLQTNGTASK